MRRKEAFISFIISLAAGVCFEFMKNAIVAIQDLQLNGVYTFIIVMLVCICVTLGLKLHGYKAIMNKVNVHGKEYYDIFEDIVYYQIHKPRNMMEIDLLKWDFEFTPNPQNSRFLDLHAKWKIDFTANQERIKEVNIGISGGNNVSEESMKIEVYQGNGKTAYQFRREQDDHTFLHTYLNTYVVKNKSDEITLKYDWEKFIITDLKDDYIYLFPYAHALSIKKFELVTTHPYKCKAIVVVLKHKWSGEYDKIEVDNKRSSSLKIEIPEIEYGEKHRIVFNEIDVKSVYLVIFEKCPELVKAEVCPIGNLSNV